MSTSRIPFTAEDLNELLALLDAGPYQMLQLETGHFKLSLQRGDKGWTQDMQTLTKPALINELQSPADKTEPEAAHEHVVAGLINVPAPMAGVFYRAPQPGAAPFVEVGTAVREDSIIAIIEVMKLMSSMRAGVRGIIVEILKDNADLIEQGETLFRVKPD
ncbi:MAG: biotin/lipoyl-containing protein [Pseudomonadales bacterium]|nr:biotin/lipoyl-containing protein [Pseudomonadales bacterium]